MNSKNVESRLKKRFERRVEEEKDIKRGIDYIKDQIVPITKKGDFIEIKYKNKRYNIVRLESDVGIKRFSEDEKDLVPFSELSINLHEELIRVILSDIRHYQIRDSFSNLNSEIIRKCDMITSDLSL